MITKPCPFEKVEKDIGHQVYISENHLQVLCSCGASGPIMANEEHAIIGWNKQTERGLVNQECCYVLYWTRQNGEVEFALDIDKNVQLYDEDRSAREANNRTCFRKKIGFRFVQS